MENEYFKWTVEDTQNKVRTSERTTKNSFRDVFKRRREEKIVEFSKSFEKNSYLLALDDDDQVFYLHLRNMN